MSIKKGVIALKLIATLLAVFSFASCTVTITGLGKPVTGENDFSGFANVGACNGRLSLSLALISQG